MEPIHDFRPELSSGIYSFTREIFADETTYQKVRKHISDPNDVITDQDLENIKTLMTPAGEISKAVNE